MDVFGPAALVLTRRGTRTAVIGRLESEELERTGLFTRVAVNPSGTDGMRDMLAGIVAEERPGRVALNFSPKDPTSDGLSHTGYLLATLEPAIITRYGRVCREEVVTVAQDGGRFPSVPQDAVWLIP